MHPEPSPTESPDPSGSTEATATATTTMTVDELAARAGVTVRTIRFYSTRGLLPPPQIAGRRVGFYGPAHLGRLELVRELQAHGFTLAAIERYLERLPADATPEDLALHRALMAPWVPHLPHDVDLPALEHEAGRPLSQAELDHLVTLGAVERGPEPGRFRVNPASLSLCLQFLDLPVTFETVRAAKEVIDEHTSLAAQQLQALFREAVWKPYQEGPATPEDRRQLTELLDRTKPLLTQAVVTAFQQAVSQAIRDAVPTTPPSSSK